MRAVRMVLWGLVIMSAAAFSGVYAGKFLLGNEPSAASSAGAAFMRARYEGAGGPFTLIDTDGETVTADELFAKPTAMFFGFTHCPDICPSTMVDASSWLEALGTDADRINLAFVSVDPMRDTPANLGRYLSAFDERIIGLTAQDEATVADMAEDYGIVFEKVPLRSGDYTMNHSADILLFEAGGGYRGYIPYGGGFAASPDAKAAADASAVADLRRLIGAGA